MLSDRLLSEQYLQLGTVMEEVVVILATTHPARCYVRERYGVPRWQRGGEVLN